jgi:hypothetical protein
MCKLVRLYILNKHARRLGKFLKLRDTNVMTQRNFQIRSDKFNKYRLCTSEVRSLGKNSGTKMCSIMHNSALLFLLWPGLLGYEALSLGK